MKSLPGIFKGEGAVLPFTLLVYSSVSVSRYSGISEQRISVRMIVHVHVHVHAHVHRACHFIQRLVVKNGCTRRVLSAYGYSCVVVVGTLPVCALHALQGRSFH